MIFNKEDHTYFEGKVQYQPVSDWYKQFIRPFLEGPASIGVAKKEKVEQQYVLDGWDCKRTYSADYGNAIHGAVEYWLKYKKMPDHPHLIDAVNSFKKVHKKLYSKFKIKNVASEMVVYDKKIKVAGTLDVTTGIGNKKVFIDDIKTNGNLYKEGYNRMLAPFQRMRDGNINKYTLQLSMYKYLAEAMGLKVVGVNILHWNGVKFEAIEIEVVDLKEALLKSKK